MTAVYNLWSLRKSPCRPPCFLLQDGSSILHNARLAAALPDPAQMVATLDGEVTLHVASMSEHHEVCAVTCKPSRTEILSYLFQMQFENVSRKVCFVGAVQREAFPFP